MFQFYSTPKGTKKKFWVTRHFFMYSSVTHICDLLTYCKKKKYPPLSIYLSFKIAVCVLPGMYDTGWWPHILISFTISFFFSTGVLANLLLIWTHTVTYFTVFDPEHTWGAWGSLRKGCIYFQVWFKHHDHFGFQNFSSAQ